MEEQSRAKNWITKMIDRLVREENQGQASGSDTWKAECFFAPVKGDDEIAKLLVKYCTENLPDYYHMDPQRDIQVLTPMEGGICGSNHLNEIFGQMDRLSGLGEKKRNRVLTISQAGDRKYPVVVIPVTMSCAAVLDRKLLYDGVTRAGKVLVLIGEQKAVYFAMQNIFQRLEKSEFRSRFHLQAAERAYVQEKGMDTVRRHAGDFIHKRLASAHPVHDGKQTPMKGHPVFIAQHATATCCRGCLEKWHRIPRGRELSRQEQEYVVDVLMEWIRQEMEKG